MSTEPGRSPEDVARQAASRDVVRITGGHVEGTSIKASYFGTDRAAYVATLRSLLAGSGVTLTEEPSRLIATFRFSGRTVTITLS